MLRRVYGMAKDIEFSFDVPGCAHQFKVEHFQVTESVSSCFHVSLTLISEQRDISFSELSRKQGVLTLYGQGIGASRYFNGVISECRYLGEGRSYARYQLTLVPTIWFLTQRQDCRIFQAISASDVVKNVLDEASVDNYRFELSGSYSDLEYCLQYRETDAHFIQRLMAEHGMWYYFEHSEATHTMVIVDSNDAIPELVSSPVNATQVGALVFEADSQASAQFEHISDLELCNRVNTGQIILDDYNYLMPKTPQSASSSGGIDADLQRFDYPGRHRLQTDGQSRAEDSLASYLVDNQQIEASSDVMRLIPGFSFEISAHPRLSINRDYMLLRVTHIGHNPQVHQEESSGLPTTYQNHFACIARDVTFKAPLLAAPVIDGSQTAIVVGPSGEEIYTDKFGRVKVQFHWDRYGVQDEHSSCWVRVSQSMASPSWGAVYLPRIGHEVVVTFLEGDPDRPLITGAVYNGLHQPPYSLPEHKTRTVFRTQSHKAEGYHELYFEDEADQEMFALRSQKDMRTEVLNNRYRDIGNDEFLTVAGNQDNEIVGDRKEQIDGHKTSIAQQTFTEQVEQDVQLAYHANKTTVVAAQSELNVFASRQTRIGKSEQNHVEAISKSVVVSSRSSDIGADDTLNVGGNMAVEVGHNASIKSDGETTIISADKIKVQVGYSGIILQSNGNILLYGADVLIDGSSSVTGKGGKVAINPGKAQSRKVEIEPYQEMMRYNHRIILEDEETGELLANHHYEIVFDDGSKFSGVTNSKGETILINSNQSQQGFDIYVGEE